MNLVDSHSVVAERVRDIRAQAAASGRARGLRARRARGSRGVWPTWPNWAGVQMMSRPQPMMKTVEEL